MTPTECVQLVAFLAARCPAQRIEDTTPDAWYVDLAAVPFEDAVEAVRRASRDAPFVALAEVLKIVKAIRSERITKDAEPIPDADPDDVPGYLEALRANRVRLADAATLTRKFDPLALTVGRSV